MVLPTQITFLPALSQNSQTPYIVFHILLSSYSSVFMPSILSRNQDSYTSLYPYLSSCFFCILHTFPFIHSHIHLPIREIMSSAREKVVKRTFLAVFLDVFVSDAFNVKCKIYTVLINEYFTYFVDSKSTQAKQISSVISDQIAERLAPKRPVKKNHARHSCFACHARACNRSGSPRNACVTLYGDETYAM